MWRSGLIDPILPLPCPLPRAGGEGVSGVRGREGAPSPAQRGRAGEGVFLFLLLLALLFGCREGEPPPPSSPSPTPQRIVALAPNLVETLFALGLGDRVVGVGDYATWPPEAREKARLGGLFDANLERIVSLKPDLAVLLPSEKDLTDQLKPLGVETLIVPNETLADIERSFTLVAQRCGVRQEGERLAAELRAALAPRAVPGAKAGKPKVLISAGRQEGRLADILVAGPDTFYQELLDRLGAVNVFADAPVRYPKVSLEEVVARAPDVILELRGQDLSPEVTRQLVTDWNQLGDVPAVRNGRVRVLAGDYTVVPGPRLPQLYIEMWSALQGGEGP